MKLEDLRKGPPPESKHHRPPPATDFVTVVLRGTEVTEPLHPIRALESAFRANGLEPRSGFHFVPWKSGNVLKAPAFAMNIYNPATVEVFLGDYNFKHGFEFFEFKIPRRLAEPDVVLFADTTELPLNLYELNLYLKRRGGRKLAKAHRRPDENKEGSALHFSGGLVVKGSVDALHPTIIWYPIPLGDLA